MSDEDRIVHFDEQTHTTGSVVKVMLTLYAIMRKTKIVNGSDSAVLRTTDREEIRVSNDGRYETSWKWLSLFLLAV